ncbi:uncharacterized protein ACMZJ9_022249 [Mantella aurantiaca]
MSGRIWHLVTGLLCLLIISVSSEELYVQRGSDITVCDMKCPDDDVTLELYRQCGGEEKTLLENHCYINYTKSHDPRLQLDTGSGCWKLTSARKEDSCVYNVWCYCNLQRLMSSTDIRILDPVLISNITHNSSRLGQDTAVRVQFSGEESAVTWEEDGEPLPERYRLIDDNMTLIIPSVQRDDAERTFLVRIANPVSEEIREYRLTEDPMFIRMLEGEDAESSRRLTGGLIVGVSVLVIWAVVIGYIIYQRCSRKSKRKKETQEEGNNMENGHLLATGNGSVSAMESEPVPTMESEPEPAMESERVPAMESEPVPAMESELVPAMESERVPTMESEPVPAMESELVPAMESEPVPAMKSEPVPAMKSEPVPAMKSEPVPAMESEPVPAMKSEPVPAMENGFMSAMENW